MPNDQNQQPITIEDVAQPWYARPSKWFTAFAVAGGLIALSRRNKSTSFDANPLQDRYEKWRLRPMSLGPPRRSVPSHEEIENTAISWWQYRLTWGDRQQFFDAAIQFYTALRYPVPEKIPHETMSVIRNWVSSIGPNILNLTWLFEEAKTSDDALRHLWYAIKIRELSALAPNDQRWVFEIIDSLPERQRWRVKFFYDQSDINTRTHDWTPSFTRRGREILTYHPSYIDNPNNFGISLLDALELPYKEFVGAVADQSGIAWDEVHDRIPDDNSTILLSLSAPAIAYFDKKIYLRALRYLKKQGGLQRTDQIRGAVGLMLTFGPDWKRWLVELQKKGVGAHDATYWLPQVPSPGLGAFLRRRVLTKEALSAEDSTNFSIIAKRWNDLPAPVKRETTKNIITFITSNIYDDIRDEGFAAEAARWGVKEADYEEMEARYIAAKKTPSTIPSALVKEEGMTLYKLDRDDPRGLFLGEHTDCCQAPGLAAEECAWHGVESPNGGFFVVENEKGEVIAQAWTWRNHDVVMFDNIEGPGVQSSATRDDVIWMYKQLAKALMTIDPSILEVRIGTTDDRRRRGYPIDWHANMALPPDEVAIILPPMDFIEKTESTYSDSSETQFILAKRADGTRFFRSPEYMDFLAESLKNAWDQGDEDAFEVIFEVIKASPFVLEMREDKLTNLEWSGTGVYGSLDIDVCLFDSKTRKRQCSFPVSINVALKFTNPRNLNEYIAEMHDIVGTSRSEEKMFWQMTDVIDLDDELDLHSTMGDAIDLPRENNDTFGAKYLVSTNMEEFQGYDSADDASKIASIMHEITDENKDFRHLVVSMYRKLDEEEAEEYREDGTLEEECYEFQPDEWWCVE